MPALNPQTLISEGRCYECFVADLSLAKGIKLALLARTLIALVPTADVTPQGLLTYAQCYACYGMSQFEMIELALLDQISQNV
jgi:hypothetical protein